MREMNEGCPGYTGGHNRPLPGNFRRIPAGPDTTPRRPNQSKAAPDAESAPADDPRAAPASRSTPADNTRTMVAGVGSQIPALSCSPFRGGGILCLEEDLHRVSPGSVCGSSYPANRAGFTAPVLKTRLFVPSGCQYRRQSNVRLLIGCLRLACFPIPMLYPRTQRLMG